MLGHHANQHPVLEQVGFCVAWYEEPAEIKKYHSSCLPVLLLNLDLPVFQGTAIRGCDWRQITQGIFKTILIVF